MSTKLKSHWKAAKEEYKLQNVIGSGTYGEVVRAHHRETKEVCAIKCIYLMAENIELARMIIREIQILKAFSKMENNIFTTHLKDLFLGSSSKDDKFYLFLVMDYCNNDLKHTLFAKNQESNLDDNHVVSLAFNMLNALKFIHSAGIMHRDLKPANILIDSSCTIKICDFGISRSTIQQKGEADLLDQSIDTTLFTSALGQNKEDDESNDLKRKLSSHVQTRWYRAPEVIIGQEDYNQKIDVWSLGCIITELSKLANGGKPEIQFKGKSCFPLSPVPGENEDGSTIIDCNDQLFKIFEHQKKFNKDDFDFISDENPKKYVQQMDERVNRKGSNSYPSVVDDLVSKMLEFNPNKRWTVEECLDHPIFNSLKLENEDICFNIKAPHKIDCSVDDPNVGNTMEECLYIIQKEICEMKSFSKFKQ